MFEDLEIHHGQRVAVIVIGNHFRSYAVLLPLGYRGNDRSIELSVALRVLRNRVFHLLLEILRYGPCTILRSVRMGIGYAAGNPHYTRYSVNDACCTQTA